MFIAQTDAGHVICTKALTDVVQWLGFEDDSEYCEALDEEQAAIFQRATY